jgi:prepilin-type N-terminal cleavage/methylation domain-containing protein
MTTESARAWRGTRRGFTLPEAVMALVLLGLAAAGVLLPFGNGATAQAEGWHQALAAKLANDLLERIVRTPFEQVVSAWDGYTEATGQVTDGSGAKFTDPMYAGFGRNVSCHPAYVPQQVMSGTMQITPDFLVVTVQVTYRGRLIACLNRLVSG